MLRLAILALASTLLFPSETSAKQKSPEPQIINFGGVTFAWPKRRREKGYEFKAGDPLLTYDVVDALDEQTLTEADCKKWSKDHKGATWCFASDENLASFTKSIDADGDSLYEPVFGGRCTLGTAWNISSPTGDPRTFRVIEYRGQSRLVLQSHNKHWPEFHKDEKLNFRDAAAHHRGYLRHGIIVPNAELKKNN